MSKYQKQHGTTSPFAEYTFSLANLAATQTDTVIPANGGVVDTHVMWKKGCIVGYTVQLSAAITAGTLISEVFVAGADNGIDITMDTASTTEFTGSFEYGDYPFAAGATLGVAYTSDGSLAPTTSDALITLIVMYEGAEV